MLRRERKQIGDEEDLTVPSFLANRLTLPFRIMWTASMPCNERQAV